MVSSSCSIQNPNPNTKSFEKSKKRFQIHNECESKPILTVLQRIHPKKNKESEQFELEPSQLENSHR